MLTYTNNDDRMLLRTRVFQGPNLTPFVTNTEGVLFCLIPLYYTINPLKH